MAKAIPNPGGLPPWNPDDLLFPEPGSAAPPAGGGEELSQLREENGQLRAELNALASENEELKLELQRVAEYLEQNEQQQGASGADIQEYEKLLEEKTEKIRELYLQIQEMEQNAAAGPKASTPKEEELLAMSEELERERIQLQQERRQLEDELRQLREDEEVMNQQIKDNELQLARERAEMARQRAELQRLNEEIRHELDRIEKDRGLSDRLVQLRQRHQDIMNRKGAPPPPTARPTPAPSSPATPTPDPAAAQQEDPSKKKDSGLFRRFFK